MTTNDFLRMLKVAADSSALHGAAPMGDAFSRMLMNPMSDESSPEWQKYVKQRESDLKARGVSAADDRRANPNMWSLDKMRQGVYEAADAYHKDTKNWQKANTGFFANATWNPVTWGFTGRHVNLSAFNDRISALSDKVRMEKDPYERAKLTAQLAVARQQMQRGAAHIEKRTTAPMHVLKRVQETSMVAPVANLAVRAVGLKPVEESADQLANEYNQAVYDYTGDAQKALSAERKLRAAGWAAGAANAALETYATGAVGKALAGTAKGAQALNAMRNINTATRSGKILAGTAQGVVTGAQKWRFWHMARPALSGVSDAITVGRKVDPGVVGRVVANTADILEYGGRIAPFTAVGGGVLQGAASAFAPAWLTTGLSKVTGDMPWSAGAKGNLITRPVHALGSMASYAKQHPGLAMVHMLRGRVRDAVQTGIPAGMRELQLAHAEHRPVNWKMFAGIQNAMAMNLAEAGLENIDSAALVMHSGRGQELVAHANELVDNATPEELARLKTNMGLPASATPDDVKAGYSDYIARGNYMLAVQQAQAESTPETYGNKLYRHAKNLVQTGGPVSEELWLNPDLTLDQQRDLLVNYVRAEDLRLHGGGMTGLYDQGRRDKAGGEDSPLVSGMRNSPHVRKATIAYGSRVLSNALQQGGMGGMDEKELRYFKDIWGELNADERRALMSPLNGASVEQLMQMMGNSGSSGVADDVADTAIDILYNRMSKDAGFRDAFVKAFTSGAAEGVGLSPAMKDKVLSYLETADVNAVFKGMSPDMLKATCKFMMANAGQQGGLLADLPEERAKLITDKFTKAAQGASMELLKKDPLRNLPLIASLFMESKGFSGLAKYLENPAVFYSAAVLLLGGGIWLAGNMLEGEDDEPEGRTKADAGSMIDELNRQRQLLADATVKA